MKKVTLKDGQFTFDILIGVITTHLSGGEILELGSDWSDYMPITYEIQPYSYTVAENGNIIEFTHTGGTTDVPKQNYYLAEDPTDPIAQSSGRTQWGNSYYTYSYVFYAEDDGLYYYEASRTALRIGDVFTSNLSLAVPNNRRPFANFFDVTEYVSDEDPYAAGGTSTTGGGTGTFSFTDEGFDVPALPTLDATDTGFTTLYNPTKTQLKALASYMWTNPLFDLSNWKAIFANPMDAIIGLNIIPIAVSTIGTQTIKVGNLSTDVSMDVAANEYVSRDCGTITIPEYWGAYMDYAPYTKLELYLPYVGFVPLDADDVVGKTLGVVYHADIMTGCAVAFVTVNGKVHYSHQCNVATSIPINGDNFSRIVSGFLSTASGVVHGVTSAAGGNLGGAVGGVGEAISGVSNLVKPEIQRGGSMPASAGFLGVKYPFVCITRPRQCVPESQNKYIGYPVYDTVQLSSINGYTEIDSIHLESIPATDSELNEIDNLLKEGVIL